MSQKSALGSNVLWQKEQIERCLICKGDFSNCNRLAAMMDHAGYVACCRQYIFGMDDSSLSCSEI